VNGVITEKYLWQGLTRLLAVYDGNDNLLMRFEYADDRLPQSVTSEGVKYYLAFDQVGTLRVVYDSAGNIIKGIKYDTFGFVLSDSNPAFRIPFGFAGGLHDRDIGLVRFGFRDYDPETGRWTAKDPILFNGGDTDLYGYVQNDPVNLIDPYGLIDLKTKLRLQTALINVMKGANAASPIPLQILNSQPEMKQLLKVNPITGAIVGVLLDAKSLQDPYLSGDGKWYWPDGSPVHTEDVDACK
jgi:RHS repeat-associated protein